MATLLPRVEKPSPDRLLGESGPSQHAKPPRVMACVLCQQRKVKCDRKFPCANCIRSHVQCVPASQVTRRRRRRFPERELLDRLRQYEDLLRQHHIKFEPFHKEPTAEEEFPRGEGLEDSDEGHQKTISTDRSTTSITSNSKRVPEARY